MEKGKLLYKEPTRLKEWKDYPTSIISMILSIAAGFLLLAALITQKLSFAGYITIFVMMLAMFLWAFGDYLWLQRRNVLVVPLQIYEKGVQIPTHILTVNLILVSLLKRRFDKYFISIDKIEEITPYYSKLVKRAYNPELGYPDGFVIKTKDGKRYKFSGANSSEMIEIVNRVKWRWPELWKERQKC